MPRQTKSLKPEPSVDMSPQAITARLQMVGQLNELCRFLGAGKLLPRTDMATVEKDIAKSGDTPHSS